MCEDIGGLQNETLNSVTGAVHAQSAEEINIKMNKIDVLLAERGGHARELADKVTNMEVLGANAQHQ